MPQSTVAASAARPGPRPAGRQVAGAYAPTDQVRHESGGCHAVPCGDSAVRGSPAGGLHLPAGARLPRVEKAAPEAQPPALGRQCRSRDSLDALDLEALKKKDGERVSVKGKVYSTHMAQSGKVFTLNLGPNWKTCLKVSVFQGRLREVDGRDRRCEGGLRGQGRRDRGQGETLPGQPGDHLEHPFADRTRGGGGQMTLFDVQWSFKGGLLGAGLVLACFLIEWLVRSGAASAVVSHCGHCRIKGGCGGFGAHALLRLQDAIWTPVSYGRCSTCGWIICPACGACGCGYHG